MSDPTPMLPDAPTPEQVQAAETILQAAHAHETPATDEPPWLLLYSGTEPLTKGGYSWQPQQAQLVPASIARTLVGSDNLRVVQDEQLYRDIQARTTTPNP